MTCKPGQEIVDHTDRRVSEHEALLCGFLRPPSESAAPVLREPFTKEKVVQIDLIWLDASRPEFAFEVEHSTSIATGMDRFIELLRVEPATAGVAPKSRKRKLDQVLGSSHYIGAPMYMEAKVRYLWYSDVLEIVSKFAGHQPTKALLAEAVTRALRIPGIRPAHLGGQRR
jgi:hypothetical protein